VVSDEERTGWIRGLLAYARQRGVEIMSYTDYWAKVTGSAVPSSLPIAPR
jgi:hypothetical protein